MTSRIVRCLPPLFCVVLAACGSDNNAASDSEPTAGETGSDSTAAEDLVDELQGLSPEEREQRLVELAQEGGDISLYADAQLDDSAQLLEAFAEEYDIEPTIYDGNTNSVRDRLLQESEAGYQGADVVELDALGMHVIAEEGLLMPVETPYAEDVGDAGRFDDWTAIRYSYLVSAWNTDAVSAAEAPSDLRDLVASGWSGRLGLENSDVYWFAAIVKHFQQTEGLSEEEAIEIFHDLAQNSQVTSGHTATADFLAAGQFDLSPNVYAHRIQQLQADGAAVEWLPATQPVVAEPTGIALLKSARNPAGGLLYLDWVLSPDGGQQVFVEQQRTPSNVDVAATVVGDVQPIDAALAEIAAEFDKWNSLWDEVLRSVGS